MMKTTRLKNIIWTIIGLSLAALTTYKLTLIQFYYVAATNNTSAPFAAFITSIPIGFIIFHLCLRFYKQMIKVTRKTLRAIA